MNSKWTSYFKRKPEKLFLLDGFGALFSSVMLGFFFVKFNSFIGIPSATLYFLATLPVLFFIFDVYSFYQQRNKTKFLVRIIAALNISYCFVSITCGFIHFEEATSLALIYLLLEVLVLIYFAFFQLKISNEA